MKCIIAACIKDLVEKKYGKDKWSAIMEKAGLEPRTKFIVSASMPDESVFKLIGTCIDHLSVEHDDFIQAFAAHWVHEYSQRFYKAFYRQAATAREFLLSIDKIHQEMTTCMSDAHPPHFDYDTPEDNVLLMTYHSKRNLVLLAVALIKEIGVLYKEKLQVGVDHGTTIRVVFPS